jgi:hypothetical protein
LPTCSHLCGKAAEPPLARVLVTSYSACSHLSCISVLPSSSRKKENRAVLTSSLRTEIRNEIPLESEVLMLTLHRDVQNMSSNSSGQDIVSINFEITVRGDNMRCILKWESAILSHKRHDLRKRCWWWNVYFDFFLRVVSESCLIIGMVQRDVRRSSCKEPVIHIFIIFSLC